MSPNPGSDKPQKRRGGALPTCTPMCDPLTARLIYEAANHLSALPLPFGYAVVQVRSVQSPFARPSLITRHYRTRPTRLIERRLSQFNLEGMPRDYLEATDPVRLQVAKRQLPIHSYLPPSHRVQGKLYSRQVKPRISTTILRHPHPTLPLYPLCVYPITFHPLQQGECLSAWRISKYGFLLSFHAPLSHWVVAPCHEPSPYYQRPSSNP